MTRPHRFSYHRSVAPLLWVMVALSGVELTAVHLLLAHWFPRAALAASLLTLAGIGWLVHAILSMRRLPVLVDGERLLLRAGRLKRIEVPIAEVAGLVRDWDAALVRRRDTLNLALLAYPNVVIALTGPRPGRRGIVRIAHRLDDPAAFGAALSDAITRPAGRAPPRSGSGSGR